MHFLTERNVSTLRVGPEIVVAALEPEGVERGVVRPWGEGLEPPMPGGIEREVQAAEPARIVET